MVLYAFYEVIFKKFAVDPAVPLAPNNTFFFLGAAGFWATVLFWPAFLILNYTGYETFEWPPREVTFAKHFHVIVNEFNYLSS